MNEEWEMRRNWLLLLLLLLEYSFIHSFIQKCYEQRVVHPRRNGRLSAPRSSQTSRINHLYAGTKQPWRCYGVWFWSWCCANAPARPGLPRDRIGSSKLPWLPVDFQDGRTGSCLDGTTLSLVGWMIRFLPASMPHR